MSADYLSATSASARTVAGHVLVIEDDPEQAAWLQKVLEEGRHQVTLAKDGGQAHAAFMMRRPDFIVLDLILPAESGFEVCERFKQSSRDTPILIYTAIDMEDSRRLAARVGADGYLTKPVEPAELLEEIARVTETVWKRVHLEGAPAGQGRVRFTCDCGKRFKVSQVHRGRTLSCPGCGETLVVPHHD